MNNLSVLAFPFDFPPGDIIFPVVNCRVRNRDVSLQDLVSGADFGQVRCALILLYVQHELCYSSVHIKGKSK